MADKHVLVTQEGLEADINTYKTCKGEFENAYLKMHNAVLTLTTSSWGGAASTAFREQYNKLNENITKTSQQVEEYSKALADIIELYDTSETAISGTFDALDIGTSPFEN